MLDCKTATYMHVMESPVNLSEGPSMRNVLIDLDLTCQVV